MYTLMQQVPSPTRTLGMCKVVAGAGPGYPNGAAVIAVPRCLAIAAVPSEYP